ncbi:hypothetical protein QLQ12_20060 [Actinoplanes sp. NEAU-A12]|uniref:Uncharacterized protein n=1 Tax=Actinoplanes sandaracinus TaxID=3045177 RepID=A0ABT6WME1_9ACTN|nr:hypothetical protein [Actinoplanes sandaracinus]MDI6100912.1 hypothetical protein [Actinoplanes sandaracinus]
MRDLFELNGRFWDWQVDRWETSVFRLIADNDLTYHHSVEVTFADVAWVSCADLFHHPAFRPSTLPEREFARRVTTGAGHHLFTWDAETATGTVPMMVIAESVRIAEGIVRH